MIFMKTNWNLLYIGALILVSYLFILFVFFFFFCFFFCCFLFCFLFHSLSYKIVTLKMTATLAKGGRYCKNRDLFCRYHNLVMKYGTGTERGRWKVKRSYKSMVSSYFLFILKILNFLFCLLFCFMFVLCLFVYLFVCFFVCFRIVFVMVFAI
jgi:hypothetical protein